MYRVTADGKPPLTGESPNPSRTSIIRVTVSHVQTTPLAESDTKPFMRSSAVAGVTDSIRVLAASNHPIPEHPPSYP